MRIPVWSADTGEVHCPAVTPLFRSVPYVALHNENLYAALAAVDLLRIGGARESEVAVDLLRGLKARIQFMKKTKLYFHKLYR